MALREFIASLARKDVARQNRYAAEIFPPASSPLAGKMEVAEHINMMCESVTFPGQNIRTAEDDLRQGPTREIGQGVTYGDITLNFICTPGLPEKKYFEIWQHQMFDPVTWQAKFYKDYIGEINLYQLDREDKPWYGIKIYEVYPKIITGQDYSYSSSDAYQTLSIEFALHHWTPLDWRQLKESYVRAETDKDLKSKKRMAHPDRWKFGDPGQNRSEFDVLGRTRTLEEIRPPRGGSEYPNDAIYGTEKARGLAARPPQAGAKSLPDPRLSSDPDGFNSKFPPRSAESNPAEDVTGKPPSFTGQQPFVADAGDMSGVQRAPAGHKTEKTEGGPENTGMSTTGQRVPSPHQTEGGPENTGTANNAAPWKNPNEAGSPATHHPPADGKKAPANPAESNNSGPAPKGKNKGTYNYFDGYPRKGGSKVNAEEMYGAD